MGDSSQRSERRGGMGGEVEVGVVLVGVCRQHFAAQTDMYSIPFVRDGFSN